jgi:hypothetical protein
VPPISIAGARVAAIHTRLAVRNLGEWKYASALIGHR